ncbi:SAM-dependent methyltransferase [Halobium salinum]|uniref:SAM-dependent methyltransferase n=1 Tax=Halobium salinum TaxID=1364940 RepID=A0ABD5PE94_9EURY|nr:class I SAM-dependent methyltransferase [Halobium salinum]
MATDPSELESEPTEAADAFAERLLTDAAGAFTVFQVYLGDQLGYYRTLADTLDALTAEELAAATGTDERYTREWLEAQTVGGVLTVADASGAPDGRRYRLPEAYEPLLVEEEHLDFLAPLCQTFVGAVGPIERVVDAYRTGQAIPFEDYGADLHEGQARMNRPAFLHQLGQEWIPTMADVDERLRSDPDARVVDVGTGHAWSSIGIARVYSDVYVDAVDLDEASVAVARENVAAAGLDDRIEVHHRDAADLDGAGEYALATAFECVHDMPDPVGVLRTMREVVADDGAVLVMDERVGETFTGESDLVEGLMYGWSVFHCLPVGRTEEPSAETGTVMREETLREYAEEAGFSKVDVLPIESFFFRFYRLTP